MTVGNVSMIQRSHSGPMDIVRSLEVHFPIFAPVPVAMVCDHGHWQGIASLRMSCTRGRALYSFLTACSRWPNSSLLIGEFKNSNFQTTITKALHTYALKRRRRAKRHTTKTRAPFEAAITQLTNTVGDAHLFNTASLKTFNTNPFK